jgi:hypothetical protein
MGPRCRTSYPRELLVDYLLEEADVGDYGKAGALLNVRLIASVVTREEDRLLPSRSASARPWSEYAADPWLRYRIAMLPIDAFRPVA